MPEMLTASAFGHISALRFLCEGSWQGHFKVSVVVAVTCYNVVTLLHQVFRLSKMSGLAEGLLALGPLILVMYNPIWRCIELLAFVVASCMACILLLMACREDADPPCSFGVAVNLLSNSAFSADSVFM